MRLADTILAVPTATFLFHYVIIIRRLPARPRRPGTHQALVVGQHDDDLSVMVPDHPPEVGGGVGQRMLGNDELITPEVTLGGDKR